MARFFLIVFLIGVFNFCVKAQQQALPLFKADNALIQYVGRIDLSDKLKPRMWAPGVYIVAKFKGSKCEVLINDEQLYGTNHNYLEIAVDNNKPYRIHLKDKENVISVGDSLPGGEHTVLICKNTESNIGYIEFTGIRCEQLLPAAAQPQRKIEYIGDSITSGAGMDISAMPCGTGQWYDQHNAYMSYGPLTSRNLNAQWQLTSLAGIGLVHSCCDMGVVMPEVYDKLYLRNNTGQWDFNRYQPDVVTICLGQNDGIQDSSIYCKTYVKFINTLRQKYPEADVVCLNSPMADRTLNKALKKYLTAITAYENASGDKKVHKFFFSKSYNNGCGGHPDINDHKLIAAELITYLKQLKGW